MLSDTNFEAFDWKTRKVKQFKNIDVKRVEMDKLKNLKEIYFHGRHFHEPDKGMSFDFSDDDDYIRNNCNNLNWENSMSIEPSEDKDSLEQLVLLKKDVGNNVKINFESLLDESEKLVKQFKITN